MNIENRVNRLEKQFNSKNSNYSKLWSEEEMMSWCKQCAPLFSYTPEELYNSLKDDDNPKPLNQLLKEYEELTKEVENLGGYEKLEKGVENQEVE